MAEIVPTTVDARRSPSYPQRIHIRERPVWRAVLSEWEGRIAEARRQFESKPDRAAAARLLAQMDGARDQLADAVKRLPMEVGDLYAEDHHRLENAVQALERCFARW
jgi:hypothetical protein